MTIRLGAWIGCVLAMAMPLAAQTSPSPGTGTIWVGSYSGHLTAVDEATGAISTTPLKTGAPYVVRLSPDRARFYVQSANQERFEIVDVATRQTLDTFTLSDGPRHIRALAFEPDPAHKTLVVVARAATKQIDRWDIGPVEFHIYDLASHTVVRRVPWTIDAEASYYTTALRFSPDGRLLYVFGPTVTILDTTTWETVDTWDLSLPAEAAMGRLTPGEFDDSADRPGRLTGLFTMRDAVMGRRLLVVGEIDLAAKTVETFPLGPVPTADDMSFTVAPGHGKAHVLLATIGRHELWTVDLAARRVTARIGVPTRTRMQMRMSSSGQVVYLYEAGRTIELYNADASARLRTIELPSDMMYGTFVIVPGASSAVTRK